MVPQAVWKALKVILGHWLVFLIFSAVLVPEHFQKNVF